MKADETGDAEPELSKDGPVATIRMRRPGKLNRLTAADLRTLQSYCQEIAQDVSIRAVLLTADISGQKSPVFSAGYDVSGFEQSNHDPKLFENTVLCLERLPQVLIAVVNGSVYGGATDMVLACDVRIGLTHAEFRMPACALGLHYYASGLQRYARVLGESVAKQAFLTAQPLSFTRLRELGVFMSLHEDQAIATASFELALQVAKLAPLATQMCKASLNEIFQGISDETILIEREARSLTSQDFAEGRRAFAERRPPRFIGQ